MIYREHIYFIFLKHTKCFQFSYQKCVFLHPALRGSFLCHLLQSFTMFCLLAVFWPGCFLLLYAVISGGQTSGLQISNRASTEMVSAGESFHSFCFASVKNTQTNGIAANDHNLFKMILCRGTSCTFLTASGLFRNVITCTNVSCCTLRMDSEISHPALFPVSWSH